MPFRFSSGTFGPDLRPGSSTGVLHHVRICKATSRGGSVAGRVEEVDVIGIPHLRPPLHWQGDYSGRVERRVTPAPPHGTRRGGFPPPRLSPPHPSPPPKGHAANTT